MSTEKAILMLKRVHVWDYGILAFGYKTHVEEGSLHS